MIDLKMKKRLRDKLGSRKLAHTSYLNGVYVTHLNVENTLISIYSLSEHIDLNPIYPELLST